MLYSGRPSRHAGSHQAVARWDVLEILVRVVDHIPEPSQQTVRYWGFYANAARGKRRQVAAAGEANLMLRRQGDADELTRRARLSWARLIHRVYEVGPLLCPFCGAEMQVLAFILDFATARAIRRSLKLPPQEPEPLAHGPLCELELLDQTA